MAALRFWYTTFMNPRVSNRIIVFAFCMLFMIGGIIFLSWGEKNDSLLLPNTPRGTYMPTVRVGESPVKVYIADSPEERQKGLSVFGTLPPATGMFFVFENDGMYGIWMKNMKFAIDIIWIDAEGNIVDMAEHATPESYPYVFEARGPSRYVLEVASGFIEQRNITPADHVDFSGAL